MAIVRESFTENVGTGSSLVLDKPSGTAVGDLLLILVGNDNTTNTDQWDNATLKPTGFTLIGNEAGTVNSDAHVAAFYRVVDGTEGASFTVTAQAAESNWGFCIRYSGADTTTPIHVEGAFGTDTVSPFTFAGVTTTVADCLVVNVLCHDGGNVGAFSVAGTGWTKIDEIFQDTVADAASGAYAENQMSGTGTPDTATWTVTSNQTKTAGGHFAIAPFTVQTFTGSAAVTQENDTSTASGTFTPPVFTGSAAVTQADNTSTASGTFVSGSFDPLNLAAVQTGANVDLTWDPSF
jgi:hypothetical protein